MGLVGSGLLSIKLAAGSNDRSIAMEVDGSTIGDKLLTGLFNRSTLENPNAMSEFYNYGNLEERTLFLKFSTYSVAENPSSTYSSDIALVRSSVSGNSADGCVIEGNFYIKSMVERKEYVGSQGDVAVRSTIWLKWAEGSTNKSLYISTILPDRVTSSAYDLATSNQIVTMDYGDINDEKIFTSIGTTNLYYSTSGMMSLSSIVLTSAWFKTYPSNSNLYNWSIVLQNNSYNEKIGTGFING